MPKPVYPNDLKTKVAHKYVGDLSKSTAKFSKLVLDNLNIEFPISVPLHPMNKKTARSNPSENRDFLLVWQSSEYEIRNIVEWDNENFGCPTPKSIKLRNLSDILYILGNEVTEAVATARDRIERFIQDICSDIKSCKTPDEELRLNALKGYLAQQDFIRTHELDNQWYQQLICCLRSFHKNSGAGRYLRAYSIGGVDTKFIESNKTLLSDISDILHWEQITESGGLYEWLNVRLSPSGYLNFRALDAEYRNYIEADTILKSSTDLATAHFRAFDKIMIIENEQPIYAIPDQARTLLIGKVGKNLAWLNNPTLQKKEVFYWGDLDLEGLGMLSKARSYLPNILAVMMNDETWEKYAKHRVRARSQTSMDISELTLEEKQLFDKISSNFANRLEQEIIDVPYMLNQLRKCGFLH